MSAAAHAIPAAGPLLVAGGTPSSPPVAFATGAYGIPLYPHPAPPGTLHPWRVAWGYWSGARVAAAYRALVAAA